MLIVPDFVFGTGFVVVLAIATELARVEAVMQASGVRPSDERAHRD